MHSLTSFPIPSKYFFVSLTNYNSLLHPDFLTKEILMRTRLETYTPNHVIVSNALTDFGTCSESIPWCRKQQYLGHTSFPVPSTFLIFLACCSYIFNLHHCCKTKCWLHFNSKSRKRPFLFRYFLHFGWKGTAPERNGEALHAPERLPDLTSPQQSNFPETKWHFLCIGGHNCLLAQRPWRAKPWEQ